MQVYIVEVFGFNCFETSYFCRPVCPYIVFSHGAQCVDVPDSVVYESFVFGSDYYMVDGIDVKKSGYAVFYAPSLKDIV